MDAKQTKIIAIIIAIILIFLVSWTIHRQIREHHMQDDPKLKEIVQTFKDFFKQENYWTEPLQMLNDRNIMNEITIYRGNKSYTINKEKVFICLKDEKGDYFNDNTIIYVLAHECAHAICPEIGHTELFHTIFEALLVKLAEAGTYNPSIPIRQDYCQNGDPEIIS